MIHCAYPQAKCLCAILVAVSHAEVRADENVLPVGHPDGWALVWQDEFDGNALDQDKWAVRQAYKMRGNAVTDPVCVAIADGHLTLTTIWDDEAEVYRCGMIGTQGRFEQRYGYFECRVRFQQHGGHHGAFWIQSDSLTEVLDDNSRAGTEIDVIEHFGPQSPMSINLHWNGYRAHHKHVGHKVAKPTSQEGSDDFHVYGLHWTENEYVFFIDGKEEWRTDEAVSGIKQFLILSLLSSGWERERLEKSRNAGGLPDSMFVDYVRVFRRVGIE